MSAAGSEFQEVRNAIGLLRAAVQSTINELQGPVRNPAELADSIGMARASAWRIWKLGDTTRPCSISKHVPGRTGFERFVGVARSRGVTAGTLDELRSSYELLASLISKHADNDLVAFEAMLGREQTASEAIDAVLSSRRSLFEGASLTWGIRADIKYAAFFIYPTDDREELCAVRLSMLGGLHLLRPREWLCVDSPHLTLEVERPVESRINFAGGLGFDNSLILDTLSTVGDARLEMCTFETGRERKHIVRLFPTGLGSQSKVNIALGSRTTEFSPNRMIDEDDRGNYGLGFEQACREGVLDLFCHDDVRFGPFDELRLVSLLRADTHAPQQNPWEQPQLPCVETIQRLASPFTKTHLKIVPEHARLLKTGFEAAGFPETEFRGYRVHIRFPPISSQLLASARYKP